MHIGQTIREAREAAGLSQTEVARRLGHSQGNYICRIETGKVKNPGAETIRRIFQAIGRTVDFVVSRAEPESDNTNEAA